MQVSFPTDSDGFFSQECPSCGQRFKVIFGEGSEEPISYCPYCGFNGKDCWYTPEQVKHIEAVAVNAVVAPELKKLERQSKGIFKINMNSDWQKPSPPPMDAEDPFDIIRFPCCNETVKVTPHEQLFCIICGKEVDMRNSESKKVFLSHKGVDKQLVIELKKTIEILGYDPWLDEDAMPAGTQLERGLLQGMQDSCAVVFFITPSFKDEGYLETEINYAIQEKRKKKDKFAIVTLQFVGANGSVAEIPDLLKTYVWKKPETQLEALREIVRALPILPGTVDWREDISGVATLPKTKSTLSELSPEAIAILKAAVSGDGSIMNLNGYGYGGGGGGEIIVKGKSIIPDTEARTMALWEGGIEDLQRRRYIKDRGHKGEIFDVTREGYEAADKL